FTFANRPLNEVIDHAPTDVEGRPWQEVVGPELAEALYYHFNERRTGERATRHFEFEYRPAPDELRVLEFSATGLYEDRDAHQTGRFVGTYGVLRDVTEARRTQRELAQSRMKFYGLFMDSPDASYIARLDSGRLLEANQSFRRIQGLLGAEGQETDAFLFESTGTRAEFIRRVAQGDEIKTIALDREAPDGVRHLELSAKTLTLDDELCLLATVHDRTEARQAEMDRLNLQNRLQQGSKMEAIGQLAGGIAHDFNNILASMIGYAELVQASRAQFSAEQTDGYLGEVVAAGNRARDLISQLLTFTRAHRGEPQPVDVAAAISDVSRMLRAAIPGHIDIHTEVDEGLAPVQADPVQLQQIIINLLVNARDAIAGPGHILVTLARGEQSTPCAACGETLHAPHVVLSVTDSGHGIAEEVRPRMFDMYFTTRAPGKGTGIGLWLINNLIHEYHGHVTVRSEVGTGTTFDVHLPTVGADETLANGAAAEPEPEPGLVMVVDDEVSVGNFIGEVLRNAGYEVRVFNDSPNALRYLQSHHGDVTVLITDQNMPLMNGQELAEQARTHEPDLPVVLITGFAPPAEAARWGEHQGIDAFLTKPFRIDELLETVETVGAPCSRD
ncbi:MAG: ATP-binding protein, partial [Pseudomonadota bacterium]